MYYNTVIVCRCQLTQRFRKEKMSSLTALFFVFLNIFIIESAVIPGNKVFMQTSDEVSDSSQSEDKDDGSLKFPRVYPPIVDESAEYDLYGAGRRHDEYGPKIKKPCAVMVLSNSNSPTMQSLVRKYRYDRKGVLIPDSVRYFVKVPQVGNEEPLLIQLNDKAFSPLGGFIRYYKEVPPIPQSW